MDTEKLIERLRTDNVPLPWRGVGLKEYGMMIEERRQAADALEASTRREREMRQALAEMTSERDLLQEILDTRPAINAGLPESYIRWSQAIYSGEAYRAVAQARTSQEGL